MKSVYLVLLLFEIQQFPIIKSLQCIGENGEDVDWSVLYKLPKHSNQGTGFISDGLGYVYLTSLDPQMGWILSNKSIKDPLSIPGRTLKPLYDEKISIDLLYAFYNDEHPDGNTSFTKGHTKGAVAFDKENGFWLVHSVPHYPPNTENNGKYSYPHTGQMYGQSFLCISLDTNSNANTIGRQMLYNHPYMYSTNVPPWSETKYPDFKLATEERHIKKPPYYHVTSLQSLEKVSFISFAKYTLFNKDLYADLVAPSLRSNLLAETWPNGHGKMNSSCENRFHVENIDELDFDLPGKKNDEDFTTTHDHAKWAVTKDKTVNSKNYICIGDINRMETQLKRAGGTVCFDNQYAWKAFTGIVKAIEKCSK